MLGFGQARTAEAVADLRERLAEVRRDLAQSRADIEALRQAMEAARVDFAELAATAYRNLKRAEAVRRSAEREATEADDAQVTLGLVPEVDRSTPLRNTTLARAGHARRASEG